VAADRGQHAAPLDVAAGGDEGLGGPGVGHGSSLRRTRRSGHLRVAG
jgi:hypothetical protein